MKVHAINIQEEGEVRIGSSVVSAKWALENRFTINWTGKSFTLADTLDPKVEVFTSWMVAQEEAFSRITSRDQKVKFTFEAIKEIKKRARQ